MKVIKTSDVLETWSTYAPKRFGNDYPALREALVGRDAAAVVRILEQHGELDHLLPILDDLEVLERAASHDGLAVVRTLDATALSKLWGLTDEDLASVDEFA